MCTFKDHLTNMREEKLVWRTTGMGMEILVDWTGLVAVEMERNKWI